MTKTFKIAILLTIESTNTAEEVERSVRANIERTPSVMWGQNMRQPNDNVITSSQFSTFEINPRSRG